MEYVLKNEAGASAMASMLLGSWRNPKSWLKESIKEMNRRKTHGTSQARMGSGRTHRDC